MNKSIIFLDFDGVLCNSVKEAYILSRYAYFNIDVHKEIEEELYSKFQENRYLILNSYQYYYLMQILEKYSNLDKTDVLNEFDLLSSLGKNEQTDFFNKKFIEKRKELIENDFNFWNSLETPTLFLNKLKGILKNSKNSTFAILSTKNKEAIVKKFEFWNIDFNSDLIFEKKDLENLTKGEFINKFIQNHFEYVHSILIDDNIGNIESCKNIDNLSAYLTSWGYVSDIKDAKNEEEILKIIKEYIAA